MAQVRHRIGVKGEIGRVYEFLVQPEQLSGWWASRADGSADIGSVLRLEFSGLASLSFSIETLEAPKTVVLACVEGPGAWNGSELHFNLQEDSEQTFVTLTHANPSASDDDFLYFSTKWPVYLLSLRDLIETGSGRPYPRDIKIHVGN